MLRRAGRLTRLTTRVGGWLLGTLGFSDTFIITSIPYYCAPVLLALAFHPIVLTRPLAPVLAGLDADAKGESG